MIVKHTDISDVLLIVPKRFVDDRGFFSECYNFKDYQAHGIDQEFIQDNHSLSRQEGTVRGLHFQAPPRAQAKLVRCGRGSIFDVAVDIRKGSPTYGRWVGCELSAANGAQLFIPVGFAHGFVTIESDSEIVYKCSSYYAPEFEGVLLWNDPAVGVEWPLLGEAILSSKDVGARLLGDLDSPFVWEGTT